MGKCTLMHAETSTQAELSPELRRCPCPCPCPSVGPHIPAGSSPFLHTPTWLFHTKLTLCQIHVCYKWLIKTMLCFIKEKVKLWWCITLSLSAEAVWCTSCIEGFLSRAISQLPAMFVEQWQRHSKAMSMRLDGAPWCPQRGAFRSGRQRRELQPLYVTAALWGCGSQTPGARARQARKCGEPRCHVWSHTLASSF